MASNSNLRIASSTEAFDILGLSLRQEGIGSSIDMSESGENSIRSASSPDPSPVHPPPDTDVCTGHNKNGTDCQRPNITTTKRYQDLIKDQKEAKTVEQLRRELFCKQHGDKDAEEQAELKNERVLAEQRGGHKVGLKGPDELVGQGRPLLNIRILIQRVMSA